MKTIASAFVKAKKRFNQNSVLPMPDRFMSKTVQSESGCILWVGHVDDIGYGRFPYMGENKSHRVSFSYFVGAIPPGMKVLHKCDVRNCVNPDHLFIGTQAENVADMIAKGRRKITPSPGERNGMAKATRAIVDEIRNNVKNGARQCDMATKHNLSRMAVSRIIRGESWK